MVRYLITKPYGIHILSNLNVAGKAVIEFLAVLKAKDH